MNYRNNRNNNVPRSLLTPFARVCATVADGVSVAVHGVGYALALVAVSVAWLLGAIVVGVGGFAVLTLGAFLSEWKFLLVMLCVYLLGGRNHPQFFYGFLIGYVAIAKVLGTSVRRTNRGTTEVTFR